MKILKHIHTVVGEIYLWEVENYSTRIAVGEKKRSIERSEIRAKLNELGYCNEILYKDNGQPYLKGLPETFISISHSKGILALYIAIQPVGIDIEHERVSIVEGRSYFVNEQEEQLQLTQEIVQLIWGVKEAFYKVLEGQITDLKNEVSLTLVNSSNQSLTISYQSQSFDLRFLRLENLYLVYSI